jgi:hypothetical protein
MRPVDSITPGATRRHQPEIGLGGATALPPTGTRHDRRPQTGPIPRVALSREEAAASLGISLDSFERHVQPELRMIRRGKLRLVPVLELEQWASRQAEGL